MSTPRKFKVNEAKMAFLTMLRDNKALLFGQHNEAGITNDAKKSKWIEIYNQLKDEGFSDFAGASRNKLRDNVWQNMRRAVIKKRDKTTGAEGDGHYTEISGILLHCMA